MTGIFKKFVLTTLFALFASQASALFIQADWWDPTEPGVGTNRYAYSFNDPINSWDPNGNACGGACSYEDQARIDATEPAPLFDETAASIDQKINRIQKEIAGLPPEQAPTTGCNSARECGVEPGQTSYTRGDSLTLQMNALVGLRSVVPANTNEAALMAIGIATGRIGVGTTNTTRVGRWMGPDELEEMRATGRIVESRSTTTHVADPASPEAFRSQAGNGSHYVEFDVPSASLRPSSQGWSAIATPNSVHGRLAARQGNPITTTPPVYNISPLDFKP